MRPRRDAHCLVLYCHGAARNGTVVQRLRHVDLRDLQSLIIFNFPDFLRTNQILDRAQESRFFEPENPDSAAPVRRGEFQPAQVGRKYWPSWAIWQLMNPFVGNTPNRFGWGLLEALTSLGHPQRLPPTYYFGAGVTGIHSTHQYHGTRVP